MILHEDTNLLVNADFMFNTSNKPIGVLLKAIIKTSKSEGDVYSVNLDLQLLKSLIPNYTKELIFTGVTMDKTHIMPTDLTQNPRQYDYVRTDIDEFLHVPYGYKAADNFRPFKTIQLLLYPRMLSGGHLTYHKTRNIGLYFDNVTPIYVDLLPMSPYTGL